MAGHLIPANLLSDDEIIILALKPSGWFIWLSAGPLAAAALAVAAVAALADAWWPHLPARAILSACGVVVVGSLAGGFWQWLGRTYVLTNRRVVCVRGLVRGEVSAAVLAEVARAVPAASWAEQLVGVGSIFFLGPRGAPAVGWSALSNPQEVLDIVQEALRGAHHGRPM